MPQNNESRYKSAMVFLWRLIKPHKKWYMSASLISLMSVGTGLFQAKITQLLIDNVTTGNTRMIFISLVMFVMLIAANITLTYTSGVCVARLAANAGKDLKKRISHLLLNARFGALIELEAGDTLKTINTDTGTVCAFLDKDLVGLFSQFTMAIGALAYLLWINPVLALVTFAYTPLGMFFTLSINSKVNKLYPVRADYEGHALSVAEQILSSIPVVKSFMAENQVREKVKKQYDDVCRTEMQINIWVSLLQPACSSTAMMPKMLYLVFAGYMVMKGSLTIGMLISVFDLINYIIGPTVGLPFMLNGLNSSIASMDRIKKIENLPQAVIMDKADKPHCSGVPSIKIDNISFSYTKSTPIIKDFSFEHSGYGIVAVCGKSGSGKTTLFDLLSGLYAPDAGGIEINGGISVVSQDTYIFADTLANNVRIAKPDATDSEVLNAMKMAGADVFAEELADRYDKFIGDGNSGLSGGQKQRVSLARTILADTPIWLLDEPTSALDAETEKIILETIKKLSCEKLILISAHRKSLIDIADRRVDIC